MDTGIVVRLMQIRDLNQGLSACLNQFGPIKLTEQLLRDRTNRCIKDFVAVLSNGYVVGVASLLIEPKFIHAGQPAGHIEDVAVHPEYHGQGIGKLLIEKLIEQARLAGCYKVILNCKEDIRGFYEKIGFHQHELEMRMDI